MNKWVLSRKSQVRSNCPAVYRTYNSRMLIYARTPKSKKYKRPGQGEVAKKLAKPKFKQKTPSKVTVYRPEGTEKHPSKIDEHMASHDPVLEKPIRYEDEMAEREAKAQEEIKRKSQCVAPAFNKGPLTYIATEEQAKWVGRK